jgi:hypothetical protein
MQGAFDRAPVMSIIILENGERKCYPILNLEHIRVDKGLNILKRPGDYPRQNKKKRP